MLRNITKLRSLKIWGFFGSPNFKGLEICGRLSPPPPPQAKIYLGKYSHLSFTHWGCWRLGIPSLLQSLWSNFAFCMGLAFLSLVPRFGFLKPWPWAPGTCRYHQGYTGFSAGLPIFFFFFLAALGLHYCAQAFSSCGERCAGFLLRWLLLLQSMGSRHAGFSSFGSWALERRLSSCGSQA